MREKVEGADHAQIVGIFAEFMAVVPLASKGEGNLLAGLMEGFKDMGGEPETVLYGRPASLIVNTQCSIFNRTRLSYTSEASTESTTTYITSLCSSLKVAYK